MVESVTMAEMEAWKVMTIRTPNQMTTTKMMTRRTTRMRTSRLTNTRHDLLLLLLLPTLCLLVNSCRNKSRVYFKRKFNLLYSLSAWYPQYWLGLLVFIIMFMVCLKLQIIKCYILLCELFFIYLLTELQLEWT